MLDKNKSKMSLDETEKVAMAPVVARIRQDLENAEHSRLPFETQWLKNLAAYRALDDQRVGENGDSGVFRKSEKFKTYIRTTTVKTRAAYSQIMESLLQNSRFPLMIEATPVPEGAPRIATNDPSVQAKESQEDFGIGFAGDGRELAPGAVEGSENMWKEKDPMYQSLNEGHTNDPNFAQLSPAGRAAEKVTRIIQDQLEESQAHVELRKTVLETCLLGTGIMKGVFTEYKTQHRWVNGEYMPIEKKFPKVKSVSPWNLYIDPNASTIDDAEWVIERHRMTAKQLRELKKSKHFRKDVIDKCLRHGGNYTQRAFEHEVLENDSIHDTSRLYEVLEYWGYMSVEEATQAGMPIQGTQGDQVQVNVWICGTDILRVITNPYLPQRLPYFLTCYEVDPYSIYGTGVPEAMQDSQKMINGFARMAIDNLALAGNVMLDVDESMLVPGQTLESAPGKIFRRQGGQTGQAIHSIDVKNTAPENLQMMEQFRRIADESTGIPSVSHGQTGVSGVGRTSSGLNMILENASLNVKTVIRNIDDMLLQPLGHMLFYWNHQYNTAEMPSGDYDVVATGIRSYTKNEVKVQRIQTLLQLSQNPAMAPMIKMQYLIRELIKGMDMNPDEALNDMEEAKLAAAIMGAAGGVNGGTGGTTGPGPEQGMATPDSSSFTGNTAGAGNTEGLNGQA